MKVSYDMVSNVYNYGTQYISQTSSKPFTIPTEGLTNEKTTTQTQKVTGSLGGPGREALTYIGYDDFDVFKEIAEKGSFNLPELMQTKTTPTRSDEEILRDMEELAREHARMGTLQNNDDKRFAKLMDEYISSVSPDREGLLRKETNEILERLTNEMYIGKDDDEDPKKKKELIDYLMEAIDTRKGGNKEKNDNDIDIINNFIAVRGNNIAAFSNSNTYGNGNIIATRSDGYYTQIDYDRGDGKVTSLVYDNNGNLQPGIIIKSDMYEATSMQKGVVDSAFFHNENGENIASYHDNKLYQRYTKAENGRMQEILGVYNAAFDVAYGRQNNNNGNSIMDKTYNSTYEKLMSGVA